MGGEEDPLVESSLYAPVSPRTCPPMLCPPGAAASQSADPPSSEWLPLGSAPALQETHLRSTLTSDIRLRAHAFGMLPGDPSAQPSRRWSSGKLAFPGHLVTTWRVPGEGCLMDTLPGPAPLQQSPCQK